MARFEVFLTGATGTVGSGILESLTSTGNYHVTCLVRDPGQFAAVEAFGARAILGDMADAELFRRTGAEHSFEFIIHAAQAHYRRFSAEEVDRLERLAVRNLEWLHGARTRLMVFTGGVWSYGRGASGGPINESTPLQPFAQARERAALLMELARQKDFPWVQFCLPSIVYGSVGPAKEIARLFRRGEAIDVLDDNSVYWSVIERLDLGRAYEQLLQHGHAGDVFVVAEDAPVSAPLFYETIANHVKAGRVVRKPLADFFTDDEDGWLEMLRTSQPVDTSRFKQRTGWRARETFLTSIGRILDEG